MIRVCLCTIVMVCVASGAAEPEFRPLLDQDLPPLAVSIDRDEDGNIQTIVTSEWVDRIGSGSQQTYYRYRQGYDYQRKEGFHRVYSLEDQLIRENRGSQIRPSISREELLEAFEAFKNHPDVQLQLKQATSPIMLYGGFNYSGPAAGQKCADGWRCVLVVAQTIESSSLAHSVVRLNDKQVVVADLDAAIAAQRTNQPMREN